MGRRRRSGSMTCRREAREGFSISRQDSMAYPNTATFITMTNLTAASLGNLLDSI